MNQKNDFTDRIHVSKVKSFQYRIELPLKAGNRASKYILNLTPGPIRYAT